MEQEHKINQVEISYTCDKCNKGEMKFTGQSVTRLTTEYEHKCTNCGNIQFFNRRYPYIKTIRFA